MHEDDPIEAMLKQIGENALLIARTTRAINDNLAQANVLADERASLETTLASLKDFRAALSEELVKLQYDNI